MNGDSYRNRRNGFETMDGGQMPPPRKNNPTGKSPALLPHCLFLSFCCSTQPMKSKSRNRLY